MFRWGAGRRLAVLGWLCLCLPLTGLAVEPPQLAPPVFADGRGLPAGSGSVGQGRVLYRERCAACHGPEGQGGTALELRGDPDLLDTPYPDRGIAVYWPNAPALFDYIRRAMPPAEPGSLSVDETYAIVAFLLRINGLLEAGQSADASLLRNLRMPNADGFIDHSAPDW